MTLRKTLTLLLALGVLAAPIAAARPSDRSQARAQETLPGSLELVGHEPLEMRGMNAALAVHGNHAYIGSRTDNHGQGNAGVMVVDVSKPDAPKVVSKIEEPHENNPGETSREMRVWKSKDLLIVMNLFSNCGEIHGCAPTEGDDNFRFYDISGANAAEPKFISEYKPTVNPHEFYLWEDPKDPNRALMFMSTPGGNTQLMVTDISDARNGKFKELYTTRFPADGSLHSLTITPDGSLGYVAHLTGGFMMIDTSDFATNAPDPKIQLLTAPADAPKWEGPGAHSAVPVWGTDYVFVADEVYGEALQALGGHGCPWGWVRMVDASDRAKPKVVAEHKLLPYNTEEFCTTDPPRPFSSYASHNPTLTKHLAIISWHSGGLQVIDLTDPAKPKQAAEWYPEPLPAVVMEDPVLSSGQDKVVVWSFPIIQDGLIYVVDVRNGLYILRYKGLYDSEVSATKFLEGNSNLGDALALGGVTNEPEPTPEPPAGTCTITGTSDRDLLTGKSGPDVICGKGGNDAIHGAGGNDIIKAGRGNDSVQGGAGDDNIRGGGGKDRLSGGSGNDQLNGGRGKDTCKGGAADTKTSC
ncbi:MAG TPA: hypothetical protein VE174_14695 [Actinomycetota bacterium]|nr:hypothetical protein [Actinomycetota bacterium]